MPQVQCTQCGMLIQQSTFDKNGGLCMPCKKGAFTCAQCGCRTTGETRGLSTGSLCLACFAARERQKPTEIESFVRSQTGGSFDLLVTLFKLDERLRREGTGGWIGLELIDPPEHYRNLGTDLYDPRSTPTNTVAFAHSDGDDVHFSLVRHAGVLGDDSPIVMTVPMGDANVQRRNFVLGAHLREFLELGCVHGYSWLEQLCYDREDTIARLSGLTRDEEETEDDETLAIYRRELGLNPWPEVGRRLESLERLYRPMLEW